MSSLILYTSGSTKEPKEVIHSWENIYRYAHNSIDEMQLSNKDIVLNVFPANVIANYTITALPAQLAGAKLISANFDPYTYIKLFNKYRPTVISLIPRHYELLKHTREFNNLNMSCVRYMVTGSSTITQEMIDDFRNKGVNLVANWYGMTEMPPPIFIGYNSPQFDFTSKHHIEFTDEGECVIDGFCTGDIFDVTNKVFLRRKNLPNGSTWKNNF
jgi:long-subunit acyl-CoA synthetase (AMP-forming)